MSTRSTFIAAALIAAAALHGGVARADGALGGASVRAPERLSETGLYADITSATVAPRNLPFEPQYPLWTDGAEKARWIRIPDGRTIDVRNTDAWSFPTGTKLWKEFSFAGKKVETRMLWHARADQWVYASYVWNDAQNEAYLAPDVGIRNHAEIGGGARHSIPSQAECRSCHESGGTPVLGFNALQLSDERDLLAPHQQPLEASSLTISRLERYGLLHPRRPDLVENPPRIEARSPRERAVLGYLSTNCGSCHNSRGPLAGLGLFLQHEIGLSSLGEDPALATAVGVEGRFVVPGAGQEGSRRVAPGAPQASALLYRMSSRRPSSQMPPLGTVVVDTEAVALIKAWIAEDLGSK